MSTVSSTKRFIADDMVGKLARFLRLLGYDCVYQKDIDDRHLIERALADKRIILTRDTGLVEKVLAKNHLLIDSNDPQIQFKQVISECNLEINPCTILSRCLECNQRLRDIEKSEVAKRVWPYVYRTQEEFKICPECKRIYWEGTHVEAMRKKLRNWGLID